ncbi:hypothetical protein HEAFMP_HEAFMP_10650, partial [Dysosmobacter welbionis]
PHHAQQVAESNLPQRQGTDHRRGGLGAAVAAGAGEHGDVGGQNGHRRQGILKVGQDHPSESGGQHQHHQPGGPGPPGLKHAGLEIRLVARQDGGHLLDVLGDLFLQDVHGVVHGDDAHKAVLR